MHAQSLSRVWLFCNRMDCSPPGLSVHGIPQPRILEWVAISSPGDLSDPKIKPMSPAAPGRQILYYWTTWETGKKYILCMLVTKSRQALWNPKDCSPPGFSVHGILQARILEWVAISFFRASSQPRDWFQVCCITDGFSTIWTTREAQQIYPTWH